MESPLLMPHQEMSGVPQTYPVYYDENKDVYYYIYEGRLTILTTGEGHLLLSGHFLCDVAKYQVFLLAEKQRAFF